METRRIEKHRVFTWKGWQNQLLACPLWSSKFPRGLVVWLLTWFLDFSPSLCILTINSHHLISTEVTLSTSWLPATGRDLQTTNLRNNFFILKELRQTQFWPISYVMVLKITKPFHDEKENRRMGKGQFILCLCLQHIICDVGNTCENAFLQIYNTM